MSHCAVPVPVLCLIMGKFVTGLNMSPHGRLCVELGSLCHVIFNSLPKAMRISKTVECFNRTKLRSLIMQFDCHLQILFQSKPSMAVLVPEEVDRSRILL